MADGDRSKMENVFGDLLPIVRAFCSRFAAEGDIDDAVQLSLEKVFSRARDYDVERPLLPWVCALSAWECQTLRTRRRRTREDASVDEIDSASRERTPEQAAIDRQLIEAASRALGDLSESDQQVLRDAYWEQETGGSAFRKRKQRALQRIREAMRRIYGI